MKQEMKNDVLINRKIFDWEWYKDVNTYKLFTHLIFKANFEDTMYRGVEVKRGQVYTGLDKLKFETGLSIQNIKTSIKKLISTNDITSTSTNKYRLITVTNYNTYQLANKQTNNEINNQTNNQTNKQVTIKLTASKELKEEKEIKQVKQKDNTARFIKPTIDEIKEYCKQRKNTINAEQFYDYNESKGWLVGKAKMKDWKASIRTWERNGYSNNKPQSTFIDDFDKI